jgi:hypothetical protein
MTSPIFLIDENNQLQRLDSAPYESEALLQRLLAEYTDVLGGAGDESAKLLLIKREYGVPGEEGGSNVWSLDHLFIDRDAVPVLVEVKRAADTRLRREVVAQMLDYAANGVLYWPLSQIIEAFENEAISHGTEPAERLSDFLGPEADPEAFWKQVEANLRSGRIRLVFVADVIPKELRTDVLFLNEQMRQAEVLAIEIRQFVSSAGLRTLVPQTVGATDRARAAKAAKVDRPPISLQEWLTKLEAGHGPDTRKAADSVIAWMRDKGAEVAPTESQDALAFRFTAVDGKAVWPFFIRSTGRLEIAFRYLKVRPRLSNEAVRTTFLDRFQNVSGINLSTRNIQGWPAIDLKVLLKDNVFEQYTQVADDLITEAVKSA